MDKNLSDEEFIECFTKKYKALMKSIARRYLIPNRYTVDDILQYIAERITTILYHRQSGNNKILDREKYFLNCLVFYCVEYQRMNGFIFCLPKRPRNNARDDELTAKSKAFSYINDAMIDEPTLVYEANFCYDEEQVDQEANPTWVALTGMLSYSEDAAVIDCIFRRNMTLLETSQYLGVAQSTCLNRRNRAIKNLYHAFDNMSGEIKENIKEMLRSGFAG